MTDPVVDLVNNSSPSTFAFPGGDSTAPESAFPSLNVSGAETFAGQPRFLTIYGGTITSIDLTTYSGPFTGKSSGDLVVHFTVGVSGQPAGTDGAVFLRWGGHIAQSAYWNNSASSGNLNGAKQISGAPWHMQTLNLTDNGTTGGGKDQDRSIQPSALVPLPTTLSTVIDEASPSAITGVTAVPLGAVVFDTATLAGAVAPTGTVTYEFFTNSAGTGTPFSTQTVTLNANGTVPDSSNTAPLAAGSYSFVAMYSGDSNNAPSTGAVEPLTVGKADTSTATVIELNGTETAVTEVALGTQVQDDATVSSSNTSFTIGGTVTYNFYQGTTLVSSETLAVGSDSGGRLVPLRRDLQRQQ